MKKIIVLAVAVLLAVSAFAQDGKSLYMKYSNEKDVSAVYISPAMFRLMGKLPDVEIGDDDVNLTPLIKSMTGMYILSSENTKVNASMTSDLEKMMKSGKYELLMEAKEKGETVRIYTVAKGEMVTSFVLVAIEKDECNFICIDGNMPKEELEAAIASSVK